MIYGNMQDWSKQSGAFSNELKQALDYMQGCDIAAMKEGRNEVKGETMYAMFFNGMTKPSSELKAEMHFDYTDIHYVVEGVERIGFAPDDAGQEVVKDVREHDALLFDQVAEETFVHLRKGDFLVLFPGEVHRPWVSVGESAMITKMVMKIRF